MKPEPRFTRKQVAAALEKWIEDRQAEFPGGPFTQQQAKTAVNALLNHRGYDRYDFTTETQAVRILEAMSRDGKLRKVPKGQTGPDLRRNSTRQPFYYTPAAWKAAEADAAERVRKEAALTARWSRIWDELARRGCTPVTEHGKAVRLSTSAWFGLLGLDGD